MTAPLVVVGASLAGLRAAEAARKADYRGPLVLVGAEQDLPYDRPPLSKAFLASGAAPQPPTYRSLAELDDLEIELRLGTAATGLDLDASELLLADERLPFSQLVVATGASARTLPGSQPAGVHVLRTLDDARAIRAALDAGSRTVVVGAGFIGSEVASAARGRGVPVTVVEAADQPLLRAVGELAAPLCSALHAAAGVDLRCGNGVRSLESRDGRVRAVVLTDGTRLPADLVVVGAGAAPATAWLEGSGLAVGDGILCDTRLRSSSDRVWAAGDVARVVTPGRGSLRVEHWTNAAEQGQRAGANAAAALAGEPPQPHSGVPYFWSDLYGSKLQMVGSPQADAAEVFGDPEGPWLVLYRRGDRVVGALTRDLPGRIMKLRALVAADASFEAARELARSLPVTAQAR